MYVCMYVCMYVNIVHQDETLINNKTLNTKKKTTKTNSDLNAVSSQCARGKSSIVRKPEDHRKIFKW